MLDAPARLRTSPVVAGLAALTVLAQICYPLVHGSLRDRLTALIVVMFAAASLWHASRRGARVLAALVIAGVIGFFVDVLGVHTGVPFGRYAYAGTLGARVLGVPWLIAFAWVMFAWPAALAARRLVRGFAARVVVGAWALASWDLFLDPQMVTAGHWRWFYPAPHLPGVPSVPLTNYAGWLVSALVISLVLQGILRTVPDADDRVMYLLYLWTWLSSVLALAAFLHLGGAAVWGSGAMGLVAVPLLVSLRPSA